VEFSIQRPLYARCISAIDGLISSKHKTSKYMGIQSSKGELILYVNRDEIVGKVTLDEKAVGDKGLFSIGKEGSILVDGESNIQAIVQDTSSDLIQAAFVRGKTDNIKEGTIEYTYPSGEKIGLQSVEENANIKVELKDSNGVFLGRELAKFSKFAADYAGAIGGHPAHANLLFKCKNGLVTFAGTDGRQFGIANFKPEKAVAEDFSVTVPHVLFTSICKLLNPEEDVSVEIKDDYVIFSQSIVFATTKVGQVDFRVVTSKEKFVNYERTLNHLDFKTIIKAKTAMMARAFERLSVIKSQGCKMKVDVGRKVVLFAKREATGFADNIKVDLTEATGGDIEINVSNQEFTDTVAESSSDDFEMKFSSASGIGLIQLDDCRLVYFTPYRSN